MTKFPGHRSPRDEFRAILPAPKTQFSPKAREEKTLATVLVTDGRYTVYWQTA
jgi:hypothetical protein